VSFRLVHDLDYLIQLCARLNPDFQDFTTATEFLNAYIATGRYLSEDSEEADVESAQEAIRLGRQIGINPLSAPTFLPCLIFRLT
jgi:hypothetical protein